MMNHKFRLIFIGGSGLLLALLMLLAPWYPLQLSGSLLLLAFLPGYALLAALWPDSSPLGVTGLERGLIAGPASYGLTIVLLLFLALGRLPLNNYVIAGGLSGLTLLFLLIAWQQAAHGSARRFTPHPSPIFSPFFLGLVVILLIAALFRMANVHYSDYQGDESDILFRAVSLIYGRVETLLTHSKGPGEILTLTAIGSLTGQFDELTTRLPFALAGVISIGLIALLGQQLFTPWVGVVAGLLAAIDGVFVSYARTAQYQSLVLLLTLAAIYGFYRFYQAGGQSRRWHSLGSFLLAASFLVHFETILLLPVMAYLTFAPVMPQKSKKPGSRFLADCLIPYTSRLWSSALIFVTLVAAFYVPFLLNPNVRSTGTYLENRIGGGSWPPFNNLAHFFYLEALKYNSAYYVILFNTLLLAAVFLTLTGAGFGRRIDFQPSALIIQPFRLSVVSLVLLGGGLTWGGYIQAGALLLALGLTLFLALVIFSPETTGPHRLLWLWLAPPFLIYVFLVNRPGKHHYLFLSALTLLVGWTVVWLWERGTVRWAGFKQPVMRWLAAGAGVALLLLFAGHTGMIFLRSDWEYILTYPDHKSTVYPTDAAYPYGSRIGFGYPFRLGWQLIGQLRRTGQLTGDWAGNDDGNTPRWYMLGAAPTPCYPHYVLRGEITYKEDSDFDVPFDPAQSGYMPRYRLWGNDRLRMTVWEFDPTGSTQMVDLAETSHFYPPVTAADFAAAMSAPTVQPQIGLNPPLGLGEGSELKNNAPQAYLDRIQQLAGRVALTGYDVAESYLQPGGIVPLTLYWQTQNRLNLRYKVFVHLLSPQGAVIAQADDVPVCGTSHANTWAEGSVTRDRHLLKLPPDLPPGDYTLMVGMYEPDLNLRLNYFDIAGNEQGNSLTVGTLKVKR